MQIIPAILVRTPEEFKYQLARLLPHFDYFQFDIQDGVLVESKTVNIDQIIQVFNNNPQLTSKEIVVDFDLMVQDYQSVISQFSLFPSNIKINYLFLREKVASREDLEELRKSQFFPTIALEPGDSIETIDKKFELINLPSIQIMTIHSGPQGQDFISEQLKKIEQLRNAGYRNKIFLDGAIDDRTLPLILKEKFQPDAVCIGSYFSRAENLEERIKTINNLLGKNQTE